MLKPMIAKTLAMHLPMPLLARDKGPPMLKPQDDFESHLCAGREEPPPMYGRRDAITSAH